MGAMVWRLVRWCGDECDVVEIGAELGAVAWSWDVWV